MKKLLLLIFVGLLGMTSCVKDGDFDALQHDIELEGGFYPSFGLPVANSEVNFTQFISTFKDNKGIFDFDSETHALTVKYTGDFSGIMKFTSDSKRRERNSYRKEITIEEMMDSLTKWKDTTIIVHDILQDKVDIDFFNLLEGIKIKGAYASLTAFLQTYGNYNFDTLQHYGLRPYFSNIQLTVIGVNGEHPLGTVFSDTLGLQELTSGQRISLINNIDLGTTVLADQPTGIKYGIEVGIVFTPGVIIGNISAMSPTEIVELFNKFANFNAEEFVNQNFKIDSVRATTTVSANFPLQIEVDQFHTQTKIELPFDKLDSTIEQIRKWVTFGEKSIIAVRFINTVPLNIKATDTIFDANGDIVRYTSGAMVHLLDNSKSIPAARVKDTVIGGNHYNISDGVPTETILEIPIDNDNFDMLLKGRQLHLGFDIATTENKHVTIMNDDKIKIYIYLIANPKESK